MENKLASNYMRGRPFGGTAVLYRTSLTRYASVIPVDTPRCTAVRFDFRHSKSILMASVYMPYHVGSICNDIEYEATVGYLQGLIDRNLGCNFVFGGDFNVCKTNDSVACRSINNLCIKNNLSWIDSVSDDISYTYHCDRIGHYSLIDYFLASCSLVQNQQCVEILVDDTNMSDHYAISCTFVTDLNVTMQSTRSKL